MCGKDYMAIRATEDFFTHLKVPLESLHLPNRACHAQREVIDSVSYYMFKISKERYLACGGKPFKVKLEYFSYLKANTCFLNFFNVTHVVSPLVEKFNPLGVFCERAIRTTGNRKHYQRFSC